MPKNLVLIFSIFFCAQTLFSKESRKPRWPLPKASRGISSLDQIRITEYRNYLQSLTDTEIKEFTEDAKISFGNFGVNPTRVIVKFKDSQTEEGVLQSLQFKKPLTDLKSVETKVLQLPQGKNNLELLAHLGALKEMEGVEYAYPDYKIKNQLLFNDSSTNTKTNTYFADKLFRHFIFALDINLGKRLEISAGYNHLRRSELSIADKKGMSGFSMGVGMYLNKFTVHYAQSYYHLAGSYHELGLSIRMNQLFGLGSNGTKINWSEKYGNSF